MQSQKISILPPKKGLEFPGGQGGWVGGSVRAKNLKKFMKLNWNFQKGRRGRGLRKKSLLWGRCGYFLELPVHNIIIMQNYHSYYRNSFVGIVHKNIQSSILFSTNFVKQLFHFFIIAMITFNWNTLTRTFLAYLKN